MRLFGFGVYDFGCKILMAWHFLLILKIKAQ